MHFLGFLRLSMILRVPWMWSCCLLRDQAHQLGRRHAFAGGIGWRVSFNLRAHGGNEQAPPSRPLSAWPLCHRSRLERSMPLCKQSLGCREPALEDHAEPHREKHKNTHWENDTRPAQALPPRKRAHVTHDTNSEHDLQVGGIHKGLAPPGTDE